jgi:hypothetical protein
LITIVDSPETLFKLVFVKYVIHAGHTC